MKNVCLAKVQHQYFGQLHSILVEMRCYNSQPAIASVPLFNLDVLLCDLPQLESQLILLCPLALVLLQQTLFLPRKPLQLQLGLKVVPLCLRQRELQIGELRKPKAEVRTGTVAPFSFIYLFSLLWIVFVQPH